MRLFVDKDRTILVRIWDNGTMTVSLRESAAHVWGPEKRVEQER